MDEGRLTFTCEQAAKWGISQHRFTRAIDQLIDRGFLDIAGHEPRNGEPGVRTVYALSNRWRAWGTPDFEPAERPKDQRGIGLRDPKRGWMKAKRRRQQEQDAADENDRETQGTD